MFTIIPHSAELNLSEFHQKAEEQGYFKHTTPEVFNYDRELRAQAWIVYQDGHPIASFAAHTMFPRPEFKGTIAYMIWNSMCVLKYKPIKQFSPRQFYNQHQNFHSQIVAPTCINWVYEQEGTTDVDMYTSNTVNRQPPYDKIADVMRNFWIKNGLVKIWKESVINNETVEWIQVNHTAIMKEYNSLPKWPVTYQNSL